MQHSRLQLSPLVHHPWFKIVFPGSGQRMPQPWPLPWIESQVVLRLLPNQCQHLPGPWNSRQTAHQCLRGWYRPKTIGFQFLTCAIKATLEIKMYLFINIQASRRRREFFNAYLIKVLSLLGGEMLAYLNFSSSLPPLLPLLFPHKMAAVGAASNRKWVSC